MGSSALPQRSALLLTVSAVSSCHARVRAAPKLRVCPQASCGDPHPSFSNARQATYNSVCGDPNPFRPMLAKPYICCAPLATLPFTFAFKCYSPRCRRPTLTVACTGAYAEGLHALPHVQV